MRRDEDLRDPRGHLGGPRASWDTPIHPCLSESPNSFRVQPYVTTAHSSAQVRARARWTRMLAQVPCGPAWPKVTRLLKVPGSHEGSNDGTRRSWSSGSRGACLLPEAIGWCSPSRGADKCMRRRGSPSRPPGRRAERGWHGVAGGGTVFVCCWQSLLRAVSCMWMRPRGATGPSPDRGLRLAGEG